MNIETINEEIRVGAVFGRKIEPKWFFWKARKYAVEKTTYTWAAGKGELSAVHFCVTASGNVFELKFEKSSSKWILEKVYLET